MERVYDKWLRRIAIPLMILIGNLFYLKEYQYNPKIYILWSMAGMAYLALVWEIVVRWLLYVRKQYAGIRQTGRRVLITFVGYLVITAICQVLFVYLNDLTRMAMIPITWQVYVIYIAVGFVCTLLLGAMYEVIYYLQKYREAVQEAETIKKAGLQSQYDRLKNQVNPHFLFNALNSLSALISEDKVRAGLFLDELSSVYRYLLQAGQRPLVTLSDEMVFLSAYRYLLNTRFGESLRWEMAVDEQFTDYWLPPLTLQTLIENALRHNSLMAEKPLTIHITTTDEGYLLVSNPIQRKKMVVATLQSGLHTLSTRFDALGLPRPGIEDDGLRFAVRLPLVRKEQMEMNSFISRPLP